MQAEAIAAKQVAVKERAEAEAAKAIAATVRARPGRISALSVP
jgi:hypothetical protein